MHNVLVPKLNNNDDSYILAQWFVEDGQRVTAQQDIAAVETSKAAVDLYSEVDGVLQRVVAAGDHCAFGDVVAYVFGSEDERQTFLAGWSREKPSNNGTCTITKVAQEMMEQHGIGEAQVRALGKKIVKRSDIEELLSRQTAVRDTTIELSRRQAAIAETVSRSHAAIPRAFLAMKVHCDDALKLLMARSASEDCMIGLTELLVKVVAGLQPQFSFFFGTLLDKNRFAPAEAAHIGITIDVGKGLFVPVIRAAAARSLIEIADTLMEYRIKAVRNTFKEEDLSGGNFSISLNTDPDTILVLPVILPDQTCMLSLSAVQEELFLTAEQAVATRSYVILGLAYDHRAINGYEAAQFIKAIKAQVESPAQIISAGAIP
jgi:2-oxoglutarate dehydrogenase E2 component (dihydrolipoamide succinyltransferase)